MLPQATINKLVETFTSMFPHVFGLFERAVNGGAEQSLWAVPEATTLATTLAPIWAEDMRDLAGFVYLPELPERTEPPTLAIKTVYFPFPYQRRSLLEVTDTTLPNCFGLHATGLYLNLVSGLYTRVVPNRPLYGSIPDLDIGFDGLTPQFRWRLDLWAKPPEAQ